MSYYQTATGPTALPANTDIMDEQGMPSDEAAAARAKAKKIMDALNSDDPKAADEMMGKGEPKGNAFGSLMKKFGGKKEKQEKKVGSDGVIR